MNNQLRTISEMRSFLLLWGSQLISGLGSAMTGYALVIWSYTQKGSALVTAMLMVCTYAPYVLLLGQKENSADLRRTGGAVYADGAGIA